MLRREAAAAQLRFQKLKFCLHLELVCLKVGHSFMILRLNALKINNLILKIRYAFWLFIWHNFYK